MESLPDDLKLAAFLHRIKDTYFALANWLTIRTKNPGVSDVIKELKDESQKIS